MFRQLTDAIINFWFEVQQLYAVCLQEEVESHSIKSSVERRTDQKHAQQRRAMGLPQQDRREKHSRHA
jgi:hypothetical protein